MSEIAGESVARGAGRPELRGSNQSGLRDHNERLVLSFLRIRGPTAKADIARETGMSAQTASVITRGLEKDGLLKRGKPVRGKVGQPSVPMRLAPEGALFFGLKVGRRSADLVLVDFLGHIMSRVHLAYRYPDPDHTLRFVRDAVAELTGRLNDRQRARIAGLGIAIPFFLWEWAATIGVPAEKMAAWRDRDIRAEIAALFDFPVYLQNDASCACGAELVFGGHSYPDNFLYFYVGYFIGGGVVLNNTLFTGTTGNAGALGPLLVPKSGRSRQLVDVASLLGLEKMVLDAGGDAQALWESSASWSVDRAILERWLKEAARGIAHAIAAACSVIDFELVLIDGWLPDAVRRDLTKAIGRAFADLDLAGLMPVSVREGTIGPDARALGAASLPLSQRFLISGSAV